MKQTAIALMAITFATSALAQTPALEPDNDRVLGGITRRDTQYTGGMALLGGILRLYRTHLFRNIQVNGQPAINPRLARLHRLDGTTSVVGGALTLLGSVALAQESLQGSARGDEIRAFRRTREYRDLVTALGRARAEEFVGDAFAGWTVGRLIEKYASEEERNEVFLRLAERIARESGTVPDQAVSQTLECSETEGLMTYVDAPAGGPTAGEAQ